MSGDRKPFKRGDAVEYRDQRYMPGHTATVISCKRGDIVTDVWVTQIVWHGIPLREWLNASDLVKVAS